MKRLAVAIVLAALGGAAFVYVDLQRLTAMALARPVPTQAASDGHCPQCIQLSQRIDELERELATSGQRTGASNRPQSGPDGRGIKELDAPRTSEREHYREYVDGLSQTFRSEKVDRSWADVATSRIQAALESDQELRAGARRVECHSQTCRVELPDDASGDLSRRLPFIAMGLADVLPMVTAEPAEPGGDRSTMVLYLSNQQPAAPPPQK